MRRSILFALILLILGLPALAQTAPNASLLSIRPLDRDNVTISGVAGAVPARAYVAVRNLFTGETLTVRAATDGSFAVNLRGTEYMPYQINPSPVEIPDELINSTTSLAGGTGVILQPYLPTQIGSGVSFAAGGKLAYGAAVWLGEGDVERVKLNAGETLNLTLEVRLSRGWVSAVYGRRFRQWLVITTHAQWLSAG
jgi:hypothetical protein